MTDIAENMPFNDNRAVVNPHQMSHGRYRRSSSRLSNYSYDAPELVRIVGEAVLCFENDGNSFTGVINCKDSNVFSINAKKNNKYEGKLSKDPGVVKIEKEWVFSKLGVTCGYKHNFI